MQKRVFMSNIVNISGSYVQNQRHSLVSEKYKVIQASSIGDTMQKHGLSLVSIKTGNARHADKVDFQKTISRFRGPVVSHDKDGKPIFLDLLVKNPHMGRGLTEILVGIYRLVCSNGMVAGKSFFSEGIRHNGDTYENLDLAVAHALDIQKRLGETIQKLQGIELTPELKEQLAQDAIKLLTPENALNIRHRLLTPKRAEDTGNDAWSVFNVVQENSMLGGRVAYTTQSIDNNGQNNVRHMSTRTIKPNTVKDMDFNQGLFDAVLKLAA